MGFLYSSDQQLVLDKTLRGEPLTLNEVKVILNDVNNYKMSQRPDTDLETYQYKTDIQLMNKYISEKYADSIYFIDNSNNLKRLYL